MELWERGNGYKGWLFFLFSPSSERERFIYIGVDISGLLTP